MADKTEPVEIDRSHFYVIQRRWNDEWTDSSGNYWGRDGLVGALATEASMTEIHGRENVKMIRRDTVTTQIDVTTDVHTEHCCASHGCKYGKDETCTVATGLRPQSFLCEDCHFELYENGGWELAHLLNELYNKGFKKAETCGSCGLESGGLCYRCS